MDLVFFDPAGVSPKSSRDTLVRLVDESPKTPVGGQSCLLLKKPDALALSKNRADFAAVFSSDIALSHWAAGESRVHVLLLDLSARSPAIDRATARVAADHAITIGILFSQLLVARSDAQSKVLEHAVGIARLARRAGVKFRVFSGAHNDLQLRDENERSVVAHWLEETA